MKTRTVVAGVMSAATALALVITEQPADAHDTTTTRAVEPVHEWAPLTSLASLPLDRLDAWATRLQQKVAAIPGGTVLTGRSRVMAKRQLAAATSTKARLGTLTGLTTEQQAKVAAIRAKLDSAAAGLRALLANQPVAAPVRVASVTRHTVKATDLGTRHHCDGFGDGYRSDWGGRTWDGHWDGFHR